MIKRKWKIWITVGALAVVLPLAVYIWQDHYLTLPAPDVQPHTGDGEEPPAVAAGLDKFDILLLGLDKRDDEPGLGARTDTILLVTIDPSDYYARILSIPRDTRVRYGGRWYKINEIYDVDGADGSVKAVEELINSRIDRYAVVDFQGVIELVDLMGGITVDVPVDMYTPLENIDLKKGPGQHLDGYDALAYMRYRNEILSDMDRSERQKEVLIQLADKLLSPVNIFRLPKIADTALTCMETSVSLQEILTLAKYGRTIMRNGVDNQVLPGINDFYYGGWYYVPFLEELGLPMGEAEAEYRAYLHQAALEEAAEAAAEEAAAAAEEGSEGAGGAGQAADGLGESQEAAPAGGLASSGEAEAASGPGPDAEGEAL